MAGGSDPTNLGTLQRLVGAHLDRMSESNTRPGQDTAEMAQQVMFLDMLACPVADQDATFHKEWKVLQERQRPDDVPQEVWDHKLRYEEARLIVKCLYHNDVLRARDMLWDEVGD